jgi:hypothetical protein
VITDLSCFIQEYILWLLFFCAARLCKTSLLHLWFSGSGKFVSSFILSRPWHINRLLLMSYMFVSKCLNLITYQLYKWNSLIYSFDMQSIYIINQLAHKLTLHHLSHHIVWYINFKIINLTYILSILNFVFTIMIYVARWIKLDLTCICFKKI